MNCQDYMMNTNELEKNRLLTKKDFIAIIDRDPDLYKSIEYIKKWKIKDLREFFKFTHEIKGQYKDMRGNCFKCLVPLRADYTHHENYCMDCQ